MFYFNLETKLFTHYSVVFNAPLFMSITNPTLKTLEGS